MRPARARLRAAGGPHPLAAVLFDLDGTLVDTERMYAAIWRAGAADQGIALGGLDDEFVGRPVAWCFERMLAAHPRVDVVRLRAAMDAERARRFAAGVPLKPGAVAAIDRFAGFGLALGVATSTQRQQALYKLSAAGIDDRFAVMVCGDEVAAAKPAPDIYREAVGRLGVGAGAVLAIEDSPAGMRAALAAGCHAVMVPDLLGPEDPAWRCAASLLEVAALVEAV